MKQDLQDPKNSGNGVFAQPYFSKHRRRGAVYTVNNCNDKHISILSIVHTLMISLGELGFSGSKILM